MTDLSAFVLAGGKSTRMGQDKAFLRLGDMSLLEIALNKAKAVAQNIYIVGDGNKFARYGPVVEDIYPDRGPLGGIHAALSQSQTELNLMMAVDTPSISEKFLDLLIVQARESNAVVTVPRIEGRFHPLCAIYRREFASVCEQALVRGHNQVHALFADTAVRVVEADEIIRMGFFPEMFRNINTEYDWHQACLRENQKTGDVQS